MVRILHLIETCGPGGAETVLLNIIKNLDPSKYYSTVGLLGDGWLTQQIRSHGIHHHIFKSHQSIDFKFLIDIVRFVKRENIQIIHSHLFDMNVYSCLAGFLTFVPVITTFHDTVNWAQSNNLSSLLKKYILKNGATYYIAVSDYVKMLLTKKFTINANNIKTIYNGIDLNHFRCSKDKDEIRKRFGFQSSDILIAMVGNIRPAKGYEIFIQSIPEILDYYPHSKFLIVGEGKGSLLDSLISLAAKLNVTNHVHFLGFQSEIKEILEMIDIFILSSISEGLSIATIEAMAMEKPVVVSKSGGPQEIVQDGVNGLLFENGNPADLAKKVLFLLSNQSLSKTLGIKAKKTVAERFSLDKMLLEYQSVYDLYR